MRGSWPLWILGGGIVLVDQWTKWLASRFLSFYSGVGVIPNVLDFQLVYNYGAAYGIFQNQRIALIGVSIAVLIACWVFRHMIITSRWSMVGVVILVGGAIGNLMDRVVHGFVIDFINIHIIPVFNVADMCINLGIGCFIVEYIIFRRAARD